MIKQAVFFLLLLHAVVAQILAQQKPVYTYLADLSGAGSPNVTVKGPARIIEHDGRKALNTTSIHSSVELKQHSLKNSKGTVSLWVMPLEDLSTYDPKGGMSRSNKHFFTYSFLSDSPNPQDYEAANFKLAWTPRWHPSIVAQFGKGNFYEEAFNLPHKAIVSVSHFVFKKNKWYNLALSWDYNKDQYLLYVNGILIGRDDQYKQYKLYRDSIGPSLFLGNPALGYSTLKFYDEVLSADAVYKNFRAEHTRFDKELEEELLYTYNGKGAKPFVFSPDKTWTKKLDISLTKPADMDSFYVQGNPIKVGIVEGEGLQIETINKEYTGRLLDSQVYVWTRQAFEGNLYVEFEFKVLRPGGLSLLMVQASGMNREDFMKDYPLRTGGRMTTVYGEDVRNYHWEFYREMQDMRNDVENSALMKNPFLYPLSFRSLTTPVKKDGWNKLQFLQIGNKLVGAINGKVMVEFTDDGFNNNGPVYDFGHIAIRCMLKSKNQYRNLKVYNQPTFKTVGYIN